MTSHIEYKDGRKQKPHVNIGTIGHYDTGVSKIAKSVQIAITTGDYIDPTPWTPEDHERFKKAIKRVHELENPEKTKADREIRKAILAGAGVIYADKKAEKQ